MMRRRVPEDSGLKVAIVTGPIQSACHKCSRIGEVHGVVLVLNVSVLFVAALGCILVSVSSLDQHTGDVNIRGYDKTKANAIFNVFV